MNHRHSQSSEPRGRAREITGKKVAAIRHAGRLPAVVYGHGIESESLSLDAHEFDLLRRRIGQNALVDLSVDGRSRGRCWCTASRSTRSIAARSTSTLFLVRMTEELTVDVPLVRDRLLEGDRGRRRDASAPDRERPGQGAARPSPAVDRVLDRDRSSTSTRSSRSATWRSPPMSRC
jgi:ribosomal protein L25 (general stress protein Ctc)